MRELRLRRLDFTRGMARRGVDANPFLRLLRPPNPGRPLRICLHSSGLRDLDAEQRTIVSELLASARHGIVEAFRTPAEDDSEDDRVPVVRIRQDGPAPGRVEARLAQDRGSFQSRAHWRDVAAGWLGDPANVSELIDLHAAAAVGADLVVTANNRLLGLRAETRFELDRLNVLSPQEAFPLVGVWSRATDRVFLGGADWGGVASYSWVLARALTPAAWPGFAALVAGDRILQDGRAIFDLADSALARLDRVLRVLDRMVLLWQGPGQHGLADEFDSVVLAVWAIYDNLALLAGKYLGGDRKRERRWGFLQRDWRKALAGTGDPRAKRLLTDIDNAAPLLKLSQAFRHRAVHRELLATVGRSLPGGVQEERIELSGPFLGRLQACLRQATESSVAWGITEEQGPHTRTVYVGDERYEEQSEGSALLDPLPFATRLVAHAAGLVDRVFQILDPASDTRLPAEARLAARRLPAQGVPSDWLFSLANARLAISPAHCQGSSAHSRGCPREDNASRRFSRL